MWRVLHPDEWEDELRSLSHYDPVYPYDENHEYFPYWTTDPDYGKPNVRNLIYNLEGFVSRELESLIKFGKPCTRPQGRTATIA